MKALPSDLATARHKGALKELRTADFGPLMMEGQGMPAFATLDGQPIAILPLDAYRQLVAAAVQSIAPAKADKPAVEPQLGLSTIERDPEVAEFIRSRFRGGVTVDQIRDACRNKFGEDRTPSRSRVQRFREALRQAR